MKTNQYKGLKGISYLPTYARNPYDAWIDFDTVTIERELKYAKNIGFNTIKTWLHYHAYLDNPSKNLKDIETFLCLCDKLGFKVIFSLFDNGGIEWDSRNPGMDNLGTDNWNDYDKYIEAVVSKHVNDNRILMWESMSEPFSAPLILWINDIGGRSYEALFRTSDFESTCLTVLKRIPSIFPFLEHCYKKIKEFDKKALVTIGAANHMEAKYIIEYEDVISIHSYEANADKLKEILDVIRDFADSANKPLILSEWGSSAFSHPLAGTTGDQARYYNRIMPIILNSNIGWCIRALMVGIEPYAYQALVHMNGVERSAVGVIRRHLGTEKK